MDALAALGRLVPTLEQRVQEELPLALAVRLGLASGSGAALLDRLVTCAERRPGDPEEMGVVGELHLMLARREHGGAAYDRAREYADIALRRGTEPGDPRLRGAAVVEQARLALGYCGGPGTSSSLQLYDDAIAVLSGGAVETAVVTQRANAAVTVSLDGQVQRAMELYELTYPALMRAGGASTRPSSW